MQSCIYEGTVKHSRYEPVLHSFKYRLFMMYLDLEELDKVFSDSRLFSNGRCNFAWFKRKDYMAPADVSLRDAVSKCVKDKTGRETEGPIRILTHLRYFGYCYNPVSFYYCFTKDGGQVEHIVAEINNTPWDERFQYVLVPKDQKDKFHKFEFDKEFHISPFMPMNLRYKWGFNVPGERVHVHMKDLLEGKKVFDVTLSLDRKEINAKSLRSVLWRYPFMTLKVVMGIYWNAFRLHRKKAVFYTHPDKIENKDGDS